LYYAPIYEIANQVILIPREASFTPYGSGACKGLFPENYRELWVTSKNNIKKQTMTRYRPACWQPFSMRMLGNDVLLPLSPPLPPLPPLPLVMLYLEDVGDPGRA